MHSFGFDVDLVVSEEEFVVGVVIDVVKVVVIGTVDAIVMVNTVVVAVLDAAAVVTVDTPALLTETGTMTTRGLHADTTAFSLCDLSEGMLLDDGAGLGSFIFGD